MIVSKINELFRDEIFPGFPFRNIDWLAMVFERDRYNNTRMPEWFFRTIARHFNQNGEDKLLIIGEPVLTPFFSQEVGEIHFNWDEYQDFMLSDKRSAIEYKMSSEDGKCGCWADAEMTVFGGMPSKMFSVFNDLGGRDAMLAHIHQEFFLGESGGNKDICLFFRGLLFPEYRGNRTSSSNV